MNTQRMPQLIKHSEVPEQNPEHNGQSAEQQTPAQECGLPMKHD
jgi:hypothetical protein